MAKKQGKTAVAAPVCSIRTADLRVALPILGALARGKTPWVLLSAVYGQADNATPYECRLRATDGHTWATYRIEPVQAENDVPPLLLDCERLRQIVDRTGADSVEIIIEEEGSVVVLAGTAQYTLGTAKPDLFPQETIHTVEDVAAVPSVVLADAINRTQFACDVGSVRYALGGLHLRTTSDALIIEATDTRRAARSAIARLAPLRVNWRAWRAFNGSVLPQAPARLAARMLGGSDANVSLSATQIVVECGPWVMVTTPIEGQFPDVGGLIDRLGEPAKVVTSDASSLLSLCRQASICTSEDSRGVDFGFGHDVITCRSTAPEVGESEVSLPCTTSTPDRLTVTLDAAYVSDYLKALAPAAEVTIEVRDADTAIVLRSGPSWCLVMPMARN
jgi:DNA polymerase-3 subunit beta